jgi:pyridoxal 5'-phosphate synthase pdxT subunit
MKIGVLDIQGSVEEHFESLMRLRGAEISLVKKASDFEGLQGFVIPGGESTTLSKLIDRFGLRDAIVSFVREGGLLYGTCAGAILVGSKVFGEVAAGKAAPDEKVTPLGLLDIDVTRNAYGTQLDSFETEVEVDFGDDGGGADDDRVVKVPGVFIRAPKITRIGADVEILANHDDEPVLVRGKFEKGEVLAGTFHPELTEDLTIYERFFMG